MSLDKNCPKFVVSLHKKSNIPWEYRVILFCSDGRERRSVRKTRLNCGSMLDIGTKAVIFAYWKKPIPNYRLPSRNAYISGKNVEKLNSTYVYVLYTGV